MTRSRFPGNGSLILIGQFEERNAELERAAVSGEERYVTTLITVAKETSKNVEFEKIEKITTIFNFYMISIVLIFKNILFSL